MQAARVLHHGWLKWLLITVAVGSVVFAFVGRAGAETSTATLISGNGIIGGLDSHNEVSLDGGATWQPAYIIASHSSYAIIPGTKYINCGATGSHPCGVNKSTRFRASFELPAGTVNPSLSVSLHADNAAVVYLNGTEIGRQVHAPITSNFQGTPEVIETTDASLFQVGTNYLEFVLTDYGIVAGLDYKAVVSYDVNTEPTADAGDDQTVECVNECAEVTLDGSRSSDPNGDTLSYTWTGPFGMATGVSPTVTLGLGSHMIELVVDDGNGGTDTDTVTIDVVDTTAPVIASALADPGVLWPANHTMRRVAVSVDTADACSEAVNCEITSVASNEPVTTSDAADTSPDWVIIGPLMVDLRAERLGSGTGRVYTITIECTDESGNSAITTVTVTVAHDQGR